MFKNFVQFYSMTLCIIASIILMGSSIFVAIDVINLSFPQYRCNVADYSSNERYIDKIQKYEDHETKKEIRKWNDQTITRNRLREKETVLEHFRQDTVKTLINGTICMLISAIFLIIHLILYRRENRKS